MKNSLISLKWGLLLGILLYLSNLSLQAQIDLSIINPNITSNSIPVGDLETITCQLQNSGSSSSANSALVGYYLSTDTILDASDVNLGTESAYVTGNWTANLTHNITIPLTTNTGSYYILLIADESNQIIETDENNNTALFPITVTVGSPGFRALNGNVRDIIVLPNATTILSYTIVNDGVTSDSIDVGFYLSTDNTFSSNDVLIGHTRVDSLVLNGTFNDTTTVTIPSGTSPARYYLLVYVDYFNAQPELNEYNNWTYDILFVQYVLPDLTIRQTTLSADTIEAGFSVSANGTLDNNGGATNVNNTIAYYLSTDTLLDNNDVLLRDDYFPNMAANGTRLTNTNISIPSGTAVGDYYVISYVDYQENLPEINENNNTAFAPLTILRAIPDLTMSSLILNSTSAMSNTNMGTYTTLWNRGLIASPVAEVKYYLSTKNSYDSTAILIDSVMIPALNPSQYHSYNLNYAIPANLALGGYYVIVYIDPSNTIAEIFETNNTRAEPLAIVGTGLPDLAIGAIQSNATTALPSGSIEFEVEVQNLGQNLAGGTWLGYYLSTDTLYDNADIYLAQNSINGAPNAINGVVPYGTFTTTRNLSIPLVSVYGTYYVLFVADHLTSLTEGDETNNVGYFPLPIDTLYKPDLTVIAYQANQDTVQVGTPIHLSATIQNIGTSTVDHLSDFRYALSSDTILDSGDHTLRTTTIAHLGAFQTESDSSYNSIVPASAFPGEYYVLFYTDYLSLITEANENNNLVYQTTKVVVLGNSNFQPDLEVQNPSINKDSVEIGDLVAVTIELHNNTSITASSHRLSYYWSVDTLLDSTDVRLGGDNIISLSNSIVSVKNLNIPVGAALGNYNILIFIDDLQQVAESDESNNLAFIPVVITSPRPELNIPPFGTSPSTLQVGATATVYYDVRNTGINMGAGASYTGYYLSSDNVFDALDTYLGEGYIDTVSANGATRDTALLLIPSTLPGGSYYLIFYADHRNQQGEQDEANNITIRAVTINTANLNPYADFVVQNPAVGNTTIAPSFTTGVSCTVRNISNNSSFNFARVGYYLSQTPYYNSGMIELWNSSIGTLNGNTSMNVGTNIMIPPGTPAGSYYVLFFADDNRAETENNEQNNIAFRSITVTGTANTQTDLIVDAPSISTAVTIAGLPAVPAGNTIDLTSTIKNLGSSASSSFVGYYLSTDRTYSANDVYLGNEAVGSLLANGNSVETTTITIPGFTSTGTYYVLFRADYQGQVSEQVETNNDVAVPFRVIAPLADLVVQNTSLNSSVATAGDFVGVNCSVANIGGGAINGTNLGYYLSTVPSYTSAAILLGSEYTPNLAINATVQTNYVVPIPSATPSGTYYLLFYADHQDLEMESNEINNIATQTITIVGNPLYLPDVVVEQPSIANNNLIVGNSTTVDCNIRNQGGVSAHATTTGYYLSIDTLFDNTDVLIGNSMMAPINSNNTLLQTATITIPNNILAGNYYVLYVADHLNILGESNDANNVAYLPLGIAGSQSDLVVRQAIATPTTVLSGNVITVNSWVHNQGNMAIANTELGYYLSTDTLYNNGDVYLDASFVDTLQAGDSSGHQLALTIPIATTTGNYYLLYYADHQVTRAEIDKTNNIAYVSLAISEPQPDLRIQQANLATNTITIGNTVFTGASLDNIGTAATSSFTIGYYLSTDSLYSANDVLLTTDNNSGLGAGSSFALYSNITLPNTTTAGNYYVIFYADNQGGIAEPDEVNNIEAVAITVVMPFPELSLTNTVVPGVTINPGYILNVSCVVNNNSIQAAGSHRLGYYLTTSPLFTNAIPLGDTLISGLAGNGSMPQSMSITIPGNTVPGNYYIAFYIDDQFAVTESDESNNRMYVPINITMSNWLPDARVYGATISSSSRIAGETLTLDSDLQNIGNVTLYNNKLSYYLSPTATYNSSTAVLLGDTTMSSLSGGYYRTIISDVVIPANTVIGNYYILFYADADNLIIESDENNNIGAVAITITPETFPDFRILNPSAVYVNGNVEVSSLVYNIGTGTSGVTSLGYFLSTDAVYDNGDVLLGTDVVTALSPSINSFEDAVLSIPAGTTNGAYYILFVADYLQEEVEEDETNNVASTGAVITININKLPTATLLYYPNPTLQTVAIELGRIYEDVQVQVYNPLGQLIQLTKPQTTANLSLDLEGPSGVYLLEIRTKEGVFEGISIVKE
jgi:subtilase family serine protease